MHRSSTRVFWGMKPFLVNHSEKSKSSRAPCDPKPDCFITYTVVVKNEIFFMKDLND